MKRFLKRTPKNTDSSTETSLVPSTSNHPKAYNSQPNTFAYIQTTRSYPPDYDRLSTAGEAQLNDFHPIPSSLPPPIAMPSAKQNHVSLDLGFIEYNLKRGVQKGETSSGYGDHFCQAHGITRVFVVDVANHLVAMVTPQRYMAFIANQTYLPPTHKFRGNIFQFGGAVVATPRWAMRAAANNLLRGQQGEILKKGQFVTISASSLKDGEALPAQVVLDAIPYSGVSWVVLDRWMEDARSHKVSIVNADTGLTELEGKYDPSHTLPLVIREDESDMFMADPVRGLVVQDDRFCKLRDTGEVDASTKALQFRAGWYAPWDRNGVTRIMRMLKFADAEGDMALDGTGPWKRPEKAYSNDFIRPPEKDLWVIGGVEDVRQEACAKMMGTHLEMDVLLTKGSGGMN